ncbi:MAG: hypothetical protein J6S57_03290 [Alphaproteobacteria bacterium]|nr:hypothetical protein [Alphaproteobacteria bacterium]
MADDFDKSTHQSDIETANFSYKESCRVEYEITNQNRLINIPNKQSQKMQDKYNKAKEQIERAIILSDESKDKNIRFAAITQFKKTNE